ncbi:MAG: DNA topoisomerase (ATP-hydrolyzing) subunit A [Oscillospiraceae bacterium]|nr:DNA topoisomerase (ATP-hydrolyzing) subunit A [Oscillospiraceae bacterium]
MPKNVSADKNTYIEGAGIVVEQLITDTLKENFMPYAMSVIVSRALPEIDGFKPSQRKILYTMYKMGLLSGARTKSANVVGQTMRLNPHGELAIYDTMVRMSAGNEALLHPYVDSKGNFGKYYSSAIASAASRYTEVRLASLCKEIFSDIDKDTVEFIPNYDNTTTEPLLLPAAFPAILVNSNIGIAVSMASSIASFNLREICETTIGILKHKDFDIYSTLKGPDFSGGGMLLVNDQELRKIYETGRGGFRVRAKYSYDKSCNCIDVTEIPPSTTIEAIMQKIVDLIKAGKIKEITDMRNETDKNGLKLTIDLKRGTDHERLIKRLFKLTPLEDTFSCNFNILVGGIPRVMGIREILEEWCNFRLDCIKRRVRFDLGRQKEKLHLLKGLGKILLDIDKAVRIVRETEEEKEVVPNLMIGFGIDEIQAEYVAEIKLRHLNREYILKRTAETDQLERSIAELEEILADQNKQKKIITDELTRIKNSKEYSHPRKTMFIYPDPDENDDGDEEETPGYPVNVFLTSHGYLKKITPQSLRMSSDQKLKEDDRITVRSEADNNTEVLFFTDKAQVYKSRLNEFEDTKASLLGEYVPAKLGFDDDERLKFMVLTDDYSGTIVMFFENGKAAKVPLSAYETKTKRKKLSGAYSDKSPLIALFCQHQERDYVIEASNKRILIMSSAMINEKTTRGTQGVAVMSTGKTQTAVKVTLYTEGMFAAPHRYRTKTLPAKGSSLSKEDIGEQLTL